MKPILTIACFVFFSGVSSSAPVRETPLTVMFDSYSGAAPREERAKLRRFAEGLEKKDIRLKYAQGYIVSYGGRRTSAGEALRRAERAKRYLVRECGIIAERLVTLGGGYRERWTIELFIVPPGATPPAASPTINPAEVEFTQEGQKRSRRGHAEPPPAPNNGIQRTRLVAALSRFGFVRR